MTLEDDFLKGLKTLIERSGEKMAPLSKRSGMGETAIRDLFRKGSVPKVSNAKAIADALGISVDAIFSAARGEQPSKPMHDYAVNFPSIPRLDVQLSAGHGAFNQAEAVVLDHIPFTEEFLGRKLGRTTTDGLICVDVRGESMEPTLSDGDMLIVDSKDTSIRAGVYALNYGEESYVKRVEKIDKGYALISDNYAYPLISVQGDDCDALNVIGKVVWAAKTDFRR